jgi:hypothetical protein
VAVKLDLITDSGIEITADGPVVNRVGIVSVIESASDRWSWDAVQAPGVPRYGDPHPNVPGVYVQSVSARPEGKDKARVLITYRTSRNVSDEVPDDEAEPRISVGSTFVTEITQVDKDGFALNVSIDVTDIDENGNEVTTTETRIQQTEVQRPHGVLSLTRRELRDPLEKSLEFTGKVNRYTFRGQAPRTWLCLPIEGESVDGGATFLVRYEFQFNPLTWDKRLVYFDPETGAIHEQVDFQTGNGTRTFQVLDDIDFSRLRL